jgi:hypothetical protein
MNSLWNAVTCNVPQIVKDQTIKIQRKDEQKYYSTYFSAVVNATIQQNVLPKLFISNTTRHLSTLL